MHLGSPRSYTRVRDSWQKLLVGVTEGATSGPPVPPSAWSWPPKGGTAPKVSFSFLLGAPSLPSVSLLPPALVIAGVPETLSGVFYTQIESSQESRKPISQGPPLPTTKSSLTDVGPLPTSLRHPARWSRGATRTSRGAGEQTVSGAHSVQGQA